MAGEFTAGLSGGQRKILLFERIRCPRPGNSALQPAKYKYSDRIECTLVSYYLSTQTTHPTFKKPVVPHLPTLTKFE